MLPERHSLQSLFGFLCVIGLSLTLIFGATVPGAAQSTGEDEISAVTVVQSTDADGDGYYESLALQISADTSLDDTDIFGNNPGEPYFEIQVGPYTYQTGLVERTTDGTFVFQIPTSDIESLDVGTYDVTVTLIDQDGDSKGWNDDDLSTYSTQVQLEPQPAQQPQDQFEATATRTTVPAGATVSLYASTPPRFSIVDRPRTSSAQLHGSGNVTTFRPDVAGIYRIRATAVASGQTETIRIEATGERQLAALQRYAPIIHFHAQERYRPTRIEALVHNAELKRDFGAVVDEQLTMADLAAYSTDYHLELRGSQDEYPAYDDAYPPTVYGSVHDRVSFRGDEYTAYTYWLFYVFDPKTSGVASLLDHQSDTETVTILANEDGPQWIAASQHYGGERREWEKVPQTDTHPHIYPALGAHSNYFRNTQKYNGNGLLGQNQFVEQLEHTAEILSDSAYTDETGSQEVWSADSSQGTAYQVAVLTGSERWADFRGELDDKPGITAQIPQAGTQWQSPGQWMETTPLADEKQIAATLEQTSVTQADEELSVTTTISNIGPKPHPIDLTVVAYPEGTSLDHPDATTVTTDQLRIGTESTKTTTVSSSLPTSQAGTWEVGIVATAYPPSISDATDVLDRSLSVGTVEITEAQAQPPDDSSESEPTSNESQSPSTPSSPSAEDDSPSVTDSVDSGGPGFALSASLLAILCLIAIGRAVDLS
jgi:hypothetical protein